MSSAKKESRKSSTQPDDAINVKTEARREKNGAPSKISSWLRLTGSIPALSTAPH